MSELFALDAPSRPIVVTAFLAYGVLMIAFGVGVWMSAAHTRALHIVGALLVGYGLVGDPGPLFFSMYTMMRGTRGMAQSDGMHVILTAVLVLLILFSIGFGATAFGTYFRLYSIGTILVVIVFGTLAGVQGVQMAANLPMPWMGVEERLNIFGYMLEVVMLAVSLLRTEGAILLRQLGRSSVSPQVTPEPTQWENVPVASHR